MANEEHVAVLKQGVRIWNEWRDKTGTRPDLNEAVITELDLAGANLRNARLVAARLCQSDLRGALLSGAILRGADFRGAQLNGVNMKSLNLIESNFSGADLSSANLNKAQLLVAKFYRTNLRLTDFGKAWVGDTTFSHCDLSETLGLATIDHHGPSAVGIDTIYASKGNIPESFLRGCGVPESFITQMRSLVGAEDGIQFYSCFISYSSKDEEFARRLHGRMRDAHLRVWFAPEDMKSGQKLREQIETAIHVYDKLLIVLSEASLQSEWVMTELRKARKAERQSGKRKLFPVRLVDMETIKAWECFDADGGKDLAVELREYFIPDFSNWKNHDAFEAAFTRLLKDLKAESNAMG